MKLSRISLRNLGLWPDPECRNERLAQFLSTFAISVVFFTVILTQDIELFLNWGDLNIISDILSINLPVLVSLTKMILFRCYRKKMQKLLTFIIKDWDNKTSKEYNIMIEYSQFGKKITTILIGFAFATTISRLVQGIYLNIDVWGKTDLNATRFLFLNSYIPYEWNYSPIFEITYFMEWLGGTMSFRLAEAVYNSDWYYLPPRGIKNLLLIIQNSRKPVKITAGKIWVLDLQLFAQILKTSVGYLSVILTIRNA
ncbi:uncharacterized protein LOC117182950 [Belonocnema kinseyi]|uniref:uncharacterized protein LOC117182950 n=1 Tax=Belonocnema kinseyi TaxID=2817044 RepID=UPI00143DA891|nr:uncharacterized protein LOC117182950 [Belonocnema kinseyi]